MDISTCFFRRHFSGESIAYGHLFTVEGRASDCSSFTESRRSFSEPGQRAGAFRVAEPLCCRRHAQPQHLHRRFRVGGIRDRSLGSLRQGRGGRTEFRPGLVYPRQPRRLRQPRLPLQRHERQPAERHDDLLVADAWSENRWHHHQLDRGNPVRDRHRSGHVALAVD
jgi:hypothetical protein